VDPATASRQTPPIAVLLEPASDLTWLPAEVLTAAGFTPRRNREFGMADGQTVSRPVTYAILRADGFETIDEVVFAGAGDPCVLGERTLAGFGVALHAETRQFLPTPTLAHGIQGRMTAGAGGA